MPRQRRRALKEPAYTVLDDFEDDVDRYTSEHAARVALQRRTQLAADVVIDLERKGAMHHYLRSRWKTAVDALVALVEANPSDAATIFALQSEIRPLFDACDFIKKTIAQGDEADHDIEEMYADGGQNTD